MIKNYTWSEFLKDLCIVCIFILGVPFVLILWMEFIMTQPNIEKYEHTGTIGDTIGGLTAPIIGIGGALLVYFSFKAQLRANKMQFRALRKEQKRWKKDKRNYEVDRWTQTMMNILKDIKLDLKNLELILPSGKIKNEYSYDKMIVIRHSYAVDVILRKLLDYENISNDQKFNVGSYLFEFSNIIDEFLNFTEVLHRTAPRFAREFETIRYLSMRLYLGNMMYYLEVFIDGLKNNPDLGDRREVFIQTKDKLSTYFPQSKEKRDEKNS